MVLCYRSRRRLSGELVDWELETRLHLGYQSLLLQCSCDSIRLACTGQMHTHYGTNLAIVIRPLGRSGDYWECLEPLGLNNKIWASSVDRVPLVMALTPDDDGFLPAISSRCAPLLSRSSNRTR